MGKKSFHISLLWEIQGVMHWRVKVSNSCSRPKMVQWINLEIAQILTWIWPTWNGSIYLKLHTYNNQMKFFLEKKIKMTFYLPKTKLMMPPGGHIWNSEKRVKMSKFQNMVLHIYGKTQRNYYILAWYQDWGYHNLQPNEWALSKWPSRVRLKIWKKKFLKLFSLEIT